MLPVGLGGEAFGRERVVYRRVRHICGRRGPSFSDLSEQPSLGRGSRPVLLGTIVSEAASFENDGAQLGDAATTTVVEVHKREAGPGHRILQERDRRRPRQAMLAAEMQESADKAMTTISVVITAARPVVIVGKMLEHQVEQLNSFCDLGLGQLFTLPIQTTNANYHVPLQSAPSAKSGAIGTSWFLVSTTARIVSHAASHVRSAVRRGWLAFAPNGCEPRLPVPRQSRRAVVMAHLHEAGQGDVIAPSVEIEEAGIAVVAQALLVIPSRI